MRQKLARCPRWLSEDVFLPDGPNDTSYTCVTRRKPGLECHSKTEKDRFYRMWSSRSRLLSKLQSGSIKDSWKKGVILADTGFWLALANAKDKHFKRVNEVLKSLDGPLITTWPVMTETSYMLLSQLGTGALLKFIQSFNQGAFSVFDMREEHKGRIDTLIKNIKIFPWTSPTLPWSLRLKTWAKSLSFQPMNTQPMRRGGAVP